MKNVYVDKIGFQFAISSVFACIMAEAENTDGGDPYLENLNIRPARQIRREAGVDGSGKDRRKRGFNKLFVVVTEGTSHFFPKIFCMFSFFPQNFAKLKLSLCVVPYISLCKLKD